MYTTEVWYKNYFSKLRTLYNERESHYLLSLLLEDITKQPRTQFRFVAPDMLRDRVLQNTLSNYIARLEKGEPLQYVLGKAWWYQMEFAVTSAVLIPRPETEELVQWLLAENAPDKNYTLLDIGTGSACMAVAIKKNRPLWKVKACDISPAALAVAKENAHAILGMETIGFFRANILEERNFTFSPDIIISNPPYIPLREKIDLDLQVRNFEPAEALFVPDENPFIFYDSIMHYAQKSSSCGRAYMEVHEHLAYDLCDYVKEKYPVWNFEIKKDISGKARFLKAEK